MKTGYEKESWGIFSNNESNIKVEDVFYVTES